MHLGELRVGFISHTTFLFGSADGTVLLTDPYFAGAFEWQGGIETHLQRTDIRPESIDRCGAIFVSHEHGDHCDINAINTIAKNTGAKVLAPADVIEQTVRCGMDENRLVRVQDGQSIELGELKLEVLGGYDNSFDAKGRMNKFSLLIRHGKTCIWYSGDCHALPPRLSGRLLDAVFCWTSPDILQAIAGINPAPKRFVIMHHDRHTPGNFWCNRDPKKDALIVSALLPGIDVIIPDRLGALNSFCRRG